MANVAMKFVRRITPFIISNRMVKHTARPIWTGTMGIVRTTNQTVNSFVHPNRAQKCETISVNNKR